MGVAAGGVDGDGGDGEGAAVTGPAAAGLATAGLTSGAGDPDCGCPMPVPGGVAAGLGAATGAVEVGGGD
ncbi:MAG: hypothetical protein ACR2O8_05475 [Rhizobiaceae bacterium]